MVPTSGLKRAAGLAILVIATSSPEFSALAQGTGPSSQPQASPPGGRSTLSVPTGGYNPGEIMKRLANPIAAEVEGHPITLAEVADAIRDLPPAMRALPFDDLYPRVLDRLIQQQALIIKARLEQLDKDPAVRRHMQEAADRVLENEALNRLLDSEITEGTLLARYQQEFQTKPAPEEADVRVILLPSEEQARSVLAELSGGADFASVARRDSKDASAAQGGELGFLRLDKLNPEVGAAAFLLNPGQISPNPVHSAAGWFVIKVQDRRRAAPPGFAEVREQLRHEILQEGVTRAANEALSGLTVRKFNINGSEIGKTDDDKLPATGNTR